MCDIVSLSVWYNFAQRVIYISYITLCDIRNVYHTLTGLVIEYLAKSRKRWCRGQESNPGPTAWKANIHTIAPWVIAEEKDSSFPYFYPMWLKPLIFGSIWSSSIRKCRFWMKMSQKFRLRLQKLSVDLPISMWYNFAKRVI